MPNSPSEDSTAVSGDGSKATHSSLLSEDLEDKDIIEAVNHIADCSGKFKLLEHALRDAKMVENCIVKEKQDYKQKLKTLKIEVNKLRGKEEAQV